MFPCRTGSAGPASIGARAEAAFVPAPAFLFGTVWYPGLDRLRAHKNDSDQIDLS